MSRFGVWLAWRLNRLFPPLGIHRELQVAKSGIEANQRWAYDEAGRVCRQFEPYWNLQGKRVLDLGHGLGGKLPFYLEAGARSLVGVDVSVSSTRIAAQHVRSLGLDRGEARAALSVADGARMPFGDSSFDVIVSINVFEHIERVEGAVQECHRVLKPGGLAFLHLPPYCSAWGPHLENWIHFPWPHLMFSDRTLIEVAAREDARLGLDRQFLESARIDWSACADRIPGVNRVKLREFHRMVGAAGFQILQLRLLPFAYEFLGSGSPLKKLLRSLLDGLVRVPLLQEIVVTKMVYVLQKAGQA